MGGEELRVHPPSRGFLGDGLGAVLTELGVLAVAGRFRPRATRAVESRALVQLRERARCAHHAHLLQPAPQRYQHRGHTCGIRLLMGDDDIVLVEVVPVSGFHLCQWPRAIHSARWGASAPMVVWSPWPVCTSVSSGRANSEPFIESMMVPKSL